jgi:glycine/D-amino acid oxidase-like deaminating enzyme
LAAHCRLVTDASELKDLRIPTALGAIVTDIAARVWPYKFVSHILEKLLTSSDLPGSFNLQTHTAVTSLKPASSPSSRGGWEVVTPRGSIIAQKVVLATNAYTSFLLNDYADLIVPVRGQMSALLPPPQLAGENRLQNSFGFMGEAQDDYLIQRGEKERGGGSEQLLYGGGRSEGRSLGVTDDESIDEKTASYLRGALNTLLGVDPKAPELKATHQWTGIMGFSRDNKPFVGPVPTHPGVFISAGYTGHGMPNAWLCGKAAATMTGKALDGSEPEEVLAAAVDAGLPKSYLVSDERIQGARTNATVEVQDHLSGFKAEFAD